MIKINNHTATRLLETKEVGIYTSQGAIVDGTEFIIIYNKLETFLAHISEFEQDGFLIKLKNNKNEPESE